MQGLVTRFFKKHGRKPYGFIEGYDGESYFFNGKLLVDHIQEGDEVMFKGKSNEKGNYAYDIQKLEGNNNG